jgi:hypothetical protein
VIMTESSTVFGINIQAASSANATPAVQLGLVRSFRFRLLLTLMEQLIIFKFQTTLPLTTLSRV